jgi:hypothetical protein
MQRLTYCLWLGVALLGRTAVVLPQCQGSADCRVKSFSAVDDATLLYYEAVIFRQCCPPNLGGCQGSGGGCASACSLEFQDSYLATKGDPKHYLWDNLWNSVAFDIHDLVDIYEYLDENQLAQMTICNKVYTKEQVYADIVHRSRMVLDIGLVPQWDQVRKKMMLGYSQPLNANFASAGMEELIYCWHFHAASALEPIARFLSVLGPPTATPVKARLIAVKPDLVATPQEEFYPKIVSILSKYFDEWNGRTYSCPAEEAAANQPMDVAYNMAASIGITYLYLHEYAGDVFFLDRATSMGQELMGAVCGAASAYQGLCYCIWNYSSADDRIEDPDHATEDLRFALMLSKQGLFDQALLQRMLTTWFDLGLEGTDCLTCRLDGLCPTCTLTPLAHVSSRNLFLLRFVPALFDKAIGLVPFAPCLPTGCCCGMAPPPVCKG